MFDLTIQLETESDTIYRDVCLKIKEASSRPPLQSVLRYCMKMSEENSASSVFVSEPHSSIVDGKSGCQVRFFFFGGGAFVNEVPLVCKVIMMFLHSVIQNLKVTSHFCHSKFVSDITLMF